MIFQAEYKPTCGLFRNPEDIRFYNQTRDNIQRLIQYNNIRVTRGLPLVDMPEALIDIDREPIKAKPSFTITARHLSNVAAELQHFGELIKLGSSV